MEADIKHIFESFTRQISELSAKLAIAEAQVASFARQGSAPDRDGDED
jgi:hypothetical protein